ncbi:MAG TPA: lactonase family protein [Bryobacteraceae bacterium]|nr:lactonase family protein [Bryobacteraceae bacterium]
MNMNRRSFLIGGSMLTPAVRAAAASGGRIVYTGTYTGPESKGIYMFRFADGTASEPELAGEVQNPSFLAIHPNRKLVYSVGEIQGGTVSAFSVDRASGKLTALNSQPSGGAGPCYVSVDRTGKNVLVANYGGGSVAVLPVDPKDGKLGERTALVEHKGMGPTKRQDKPYAHCIKLSPDNRFALVADLGIDQVLVYRFDPSAGTLQLSAEAKLKPGAGPRHFAFHPKNRMVYVNGEMDSTVTAYAWDNGTLLERGVVSTLPADFKDQNSTAEIVVHPTGKWVYVSNRGHDSIAVFAVERDGKLSPRGHTPTGGQTPRNFVVDPTGKYLLAANQKTGNINTFRIDPGQGTLSAAGSPIRVASPVCLRFL